MSKAKQFISEQQLLEDAYTLAVAIYKSGFVPNFIVGVWRGGSTVGIYVQECLQYLGIHTDHIAIRTSYEGVESYHQQLDNANIRVHGLRYLHERVNANDRLLIVDDVYASGRHIEAVINRLKLKSKRNCPDDIRVAAPYFKPTQLQTDRKPDFYLHETNDWLVLPYELTGLTKEELAEHKPWVHQLIS